MRNEYIVLFEFVDVGDGGIICKYLVHTKEYMTEAKEIKLGMDYTALAIATDMVNKVKNFYLLNHGIIYPDNT